LIAGLSLQLEEGVRLGSQVRSGVTAWCRAGGAHAGWRAPGGQLSHPSSMSHARRCRGPQCRPYRSQPKGWQRVSDGI